MLRRSRQSLTLGAVAAVLAGCGGEGTDPTEDRAEAIASVLEESYAENSPEYAVQQLVSGYKNSDAFLIDGYSSEEMRHPTAREFFSEHLVNVLGIGKAQVLNDLAKVDIDVSPPLLDTAVVFSMRLQRNGESWQFAGVDNADQVVDAINARQQWAVKRANEQLRQELTRMVAFGPLQVEGISTNAYGRPSVHVSIPVTNRARVPIRAVLVVDADAEPVEAVGSDYAPPLVPLVPPVGGDAGGSALGLPRELRVEDTISPGGDGIAKGTYTANAIDDEASFRASYEAQQPRLAVKSLALTVNGKDIPLTSYRGWNDFTTRRDEIRKALQQAHGDPQSGG